MAAELFARDRISLTKDELFDYLISAYPGFFKGRDKTSIDIVELDNFDTSKINVFFTEMKVG